MIPEQRFAVERKAGGRSKWWEVAAIAVLCLCVPVLLFYNLALNPRPWHDEGGTLTLARTLAERGVYSIEHSEGYQTFGAVQSVGPTVVLPIAVAYRLFGSGLVQGRAVVACYAGLSILVFYVFGRRLFGWRTAFVGVLLLLGWGGQPFSGFLLLGRQALGEVPALCFMLGAMVSWEVAFRRRRSPWALVAGLLTGAAMVTKSHYVVVGFGTLGSIAFMERYFYRLGVLRLLAIGATVAALVFSISVGWQFVYFGEDTFLADLETLRALGAATTGFDYRLSVQGLQHLLGSGSSHMYFFWGLPALLYATLAGLERTPRGMAIALAVIASAIWLAYFVVMLPPWPHYLLLPLALAALFVAALWAELTGGFRPSVSAVVRELRQGMPGRASLEMTTLGVCLLVVTFQIQRTVRTDVLASHPEASRAAAFLTSHVEKTAVVETWERELGISRTFAYITPIRVCWFGLMRPRTAMVCPDTPSDQSTFCVTRRTILSLGGTLGPPAHMIRARSPVMPV